MDQPPQELEFWYQGQPVGFFQTGKAPLVPGRYAYEPYRGPGHYELATDLRQARQAWCCCRTTEHTVWFVVAGIPEHGVVEVVTVQIRMPLRWPEGLRLANTLARARFGKLKEGFLYLPTDWRTWNADTPAYMLNDEEMDELEGEARRRGYAPTVDDGTVESIVVSAREHLGIDSFEGRLEALRYYVRFDAFLPEPGAPDPPGDQEIQRRIDRAFYDTLGPERPDVPCRVDRCARGAIGQSVFCRVHHFQQIVGRACPFED